MIIDKQSIKIKDLFEGYLDNNEDGVIAYGGKLNVRPAYQREFVYKDKQRDEVIKTVKKGFPLNIMYWVKCDDGTYELLDGQQRTISICQYLNGDYSLDFQYFFNLTKEEQKQINDYELTIYVCEGEARERLEWFRIINIAGVQLTEQELRNANYTGTWLADAKRYFSKNGCVAYNMFGDYMNGTAIRQDYLETVLKWISAKNNKEIEDYMADNQLKPNASELWLYFNSVVNWVKATFPNYRKEMKGIEWGLLYNQYGTSTYDSNAFEKRISELMEDEDITNRKGIYTYVFDEEKNEKFLNVRLFTEKQKRIAYEKQSGKCPKCLKHFEFKEMEGDHITPWHSGGKTVQENCQMLCKDCNRRKSGK